jgi:phosphate transport system substrate-binding protein
MRSKFLCTTAAAAALMLVSNIAAPAADKLEVSGAAAVAGAVIMPNKAAIEQRAGLMLNLVVNGDANGLKDLYAGKTDVAMIAAPINVTADIINKAALGSISIDGMEVAPIGALSIKFVVNPANPVRTLTEAQLRDIFSGTITSWKDVGGVDQPIMVVAEVPGFGTRANIETDFLGGEITVKAHFFQALVQVSQVVAQVPNAIGYGNSATISSAVAVASGTVVKQQLGLGTKGAPSAEVKRLIEAAMKFGAAAR